MKESAYIKSFDDSSWWNLLVKNKGNIQVINVENKTNLAIDNEILVLLETIQASICDNEVELIIVNSDEIQALNRDFLGKDYATDVLSFGLDFSDVKIPNPPLGSIVISLDSALAMSREFGHSLCDEFAILFVHGLLHLLGFDHEQDNGEHRAKEIEILARFNITNPLIERTINC